MNLSDYFIPLCAVVKNLPRTANISAEALAEQIDGLIQQAQTQALNHDIAVADFHQALFPVLAWADEFIASHHPWTQEHAWQKHLLQRRYFKTSLAGREFFDRLNALPEHDIQLREVFVLCLCLGFMGKYSITPNSSELASIRVDQYKTLQQLDPSRVLNESDKLFPSAYNNAADKNPTKILHRPRRLSWGRFLLFILPPIILVLVTVGLHTHLTHVVQNFRDAANL